MNNWVAKDIIAKVRKMKVPGVYSDTKGQDSVEWIAMAIAILVAAGAFYTIVAGIVRDRSSAIDSSW